MSRRPTPEQAEAIAAEGRAVMVEAGAGAGKTGVMVDRYCRLVCEEGLGTDQILTITFTDKAAAELRQRIRAELASRAEAGSERAGELLASLGSAWITTIHGFCHRLLASHPVAAGLDPGFQVLDAAEAQRAAREAFDEALEAFFAQPGDAAGREETVAAYGVDGLRGMVVGAHEELRSRGISEPRLPAPAAGDPGGAVREAQRLAGETLADLGERSRARPLLERAVDLLADPEKLGLDELASLRPRGKAKETESFREAIETAVARVAEAGEGGIAYDHAGELVRLFAQRFRSVKERRGGIDFEDLQLLAAALLDRDEIGSAYRSRFRHLMVDEFQDTNRLQVRLFESLRGPATTLMVVGDALQSIYGFRHADLDAYREQRQAIGEDGGSELIELTGNFRSSPAVIGAINALGSELIGDEYRPLRVGAAPEAQTPGDEAPAVELLLTPCKGWDGLDLEPAVDSATPAHYLAEARALAERLRELVDSGISRGEIVVLLRAFTHLDAYEDSLARAGLRPYVVGGRGYWSQQQVSDVCALLAVLANPLDDQALFGALASPACGVSPDTLWLLRAAIGPGRHIWPALERAVGIDGEEVEAPARLGQIAERDIVLMRRFVATVGDLRLRASELPLAGLVERAVTDTGYDLAVLLEPAGEARFANVRKLMRLADEFEAREGRDLRGLLDFLAFREEAADESAAATAAEDHDGVRIMSIHRAKGLEFGVVAVPHLDRSLLAGSWPPLLTFGHGQDGRVGMQLRRLGAGAINIYDHRELREELNERDAEEGLRLFHVAATRARERLILSGVIRDGNGGARDSTPVVERIVSAFEVDREADSAIPVPAPLPRPGLEARFEPSEIGVRLNPPSPERAAQLARRRPAPAAQRRLERGPAPLAGGSRPPAPRRRLSYTALEAERERLGISGPGGPGPESGSAAVDRDAAKAQGVAVHALLEWCAGHAWREPPLQVAERFARAGDLDGEALLAPVRDWLASDFFAERIREATRVRSEVPFLVTVEERIFGGKIDLLVENRSAPPLIVDFKTDRLEEMDPGERYDSYATQQAIYGLAVAEACRASEVELAYVFLERPDEPVLRMLAVEQIDAGRALLATAVRALDERGYDAAEASSLSASSSRRSSLSPSPTASSSAAQ